MTWVGAHRDLSDYPELLGHAKNLGLQGVWLYQRQELSDDDGNILRFCDAAADEGYLTRYFQQVRNEIHSGLFFRQQFVGNLYKESIPQFFDHDNHVFTDWTVTNNKNENYYAPNSITAGYPYTFLIPAAKQASLEAGKYILLKPGFSAKYGCDFRAKAGR